MVKPLPEELYSWPIIGEVARWLNEICQAIQNELSRIASIIWEYVPKWVRDLVSVVSEFISRAPEELYNFIRNPGQYVWSLLYWVWEHMPFSIRYPLEKLRDFFLALYDNFSKFFRDPVGALKDLATYVWDIIPDFIKAPLLTLKDFFDRLPDDVRRFVSNPGLYVSNVATWIYNALPKPFRDVIDRLYSFTQSLWESFTRFFSDPVGSLKKGFDDVVRSFERAFDGAQTTISEALTKIFVEPFKRISDFIGIGGATFWEGLRRFFTETLPAGMTYIFNILSPANVVENMRRFLGISPNVRGLYKALLDSWVARISSIIKGARGKKVEDIISDLIAASAEVSVDVELTTLAFEIASPMRYLGIGGALGASLLSNTVQSVHGVMVGDIVSTAMRPLINWVAEHVRGAFPPISDAAQMLFRGKISMAQFEQVLKWSGISDEWFEGYREIIKSLPSFHDAVEMFRRGGISESDLRQLLKWMGYDDRWIDGYMATVVELPSVSEAMEMMWRGVITSEEFDKLLEMRGYVGKWKEGYRELAKKIPGASDLIRIMVREAYYPMFGEMYPGKFADFPEAFAEFMEKQGYSRDWALSYWGAHWVLPSAEQVYQMLWRGLTSPYSGRPFTIEDVAMFLKEADIDPRWRENLVQIAYKLPGRIEARWGLEWGIWDEKRMEQFLRADGVHPDWIPDVIAIEKKNVFREHYNAIMSAAKRLYQKGYITKQEYTAILEKLGFPKEVIELRAWEADLLQEIEVRDDILKAAITEYREGKIDENQLRAILTNIIVVPERIDQIIRLEVARAKRIERAPPTLQRELEALKNREIELMKKRVDLESDLENARRLRDAEMKIWADKIEKQRMLVEAEVKPEKKAKLEKDLAILEDQAKRAEIYWAGKIAEIEETIGFIDQDLEKVRSRIKALEESIRTAG
ncbi:MAG: hypothetical protein QXI11_02020 [Thermoproteota archaeon]